MGMGVVTPQRAGWLRTAPPLADLPVLQADLLTDVAIVGGGYAGLNAALRLSELGRDAIVIEAREPGFGASGRNGGQVIAGLKYDPPELMRIFGDAKGPALIDFVGQAAPRTFATIAQNEINCDAKPGGWLQPAVDETTVATIHKRAQAWKDFTGVKVEILDGTATQKLTGTTFYNGAWIDPRGGQLQPLRYARELGRVVTAKGVRVFQQSAASKLEKGNGRWHITVNDRVVSAETVLVCTNAYTGSRLIPGFDCSIIPASSIICATAPLPAEIKKQIMPSGLPISDARRLLNYMAFDPEGRFIIGARGSFGLHEPESYFRRLRESAHEIFPSLKDARWEDSWGGRFALTIDHLPHLHNPAPGLFAMAGCNGRGVAMLSRLGQLAAELAAKTIPIEESPYPLTPIKPIPFHMFRRPGLEAVTFYYRALDRLGM